MRKLLLPFFFIGTLAMIFVMAKTGAILKTASTPHGILDLEFAYNSSKVTTVLDAWRPADLQKDCGINCDAAVNTYWDFIFLFFYAGFQFLACKKIASNISGPVARAGNLIAKAALFAGFFDLLENIGMLRTLSYHSSSTVAFCTTFFSVIKWGLAFIAILYILTGLPVLAYQKLKK